ncbi:MAG: ribosome-associated translation inhibitor RaiA [Alphaproteobacteria bacterium]|jgi:ribosomal subunit interface protein|nr:ribosome-associated translation inhibitor RaiA [Alphaproteobacteria bacterium]
MQISVKGKKLDVGEAWRSHVEENLPAVVGKYFDNAQDAQVILAKQGSTFRVDMVVHIGKRILVQSHGATGDAYSAYDEAAEHLAKRLRRYKRRLRDYHHERLDHEEALPAQQYVLAGEDVESGSDEKDEPMVIAEMETGIETLSVGEAVMRMDLENVSAMMFRNRAHGGLNMVYHRGDGHIGWVDPRGNRRGEAENS